MFQILNQCSESGSEKFYESTDPDQSGKISTKIDKTESYFSWKHESKIKYTKNFCTFVQVWSLWSVSLSVKIGNILFGFGSIFFTWIKTQPTL